MSQELGGAFRRMSEDMGGKLSHYYISLQQRYGDPRVYAAQEEELRARSAVAAHAEATTAAEALKGAYETQHAKVKHEHAIRMQHLQGRSLAPSLPNFSSRTARHRPQDSSPLDTTIQPPASEDAR